MKRVLEWLCLLAALGLLPCAVGAAPLDAAKRAFTPNAISLRPDATRHARQAFLATVPVRSEGTLEYYLEASLEEGGFARWPVGAPTRCQTLILW